MFSLHLLIPRTTSCQGAGLIQSSNFVFYLLFAAVVHVNSLRMVLRIQWKLSSYNPDSLLKDKPLSSSLFFFWLLFQYFKKLCFCYCLLINQTLIGFLLQKMIQLSPLQHAYLLPSSLPSPSQVLSQFCVNESIHTLM